MILVADGAVGQQRPVFVEAQNDGVVERVFISAGVGHLGTGVSRQGEGQAAEDQNGAGGHSGQADRITASHG